MKTCKNCVSSRKIIPRNTNCPAEFVCSLSDEDFHDCISNDMWRFSNKVLDPALEDDAKQASIPYSYVENDINMREAYEAGYEKAKKEYERPQDNLIRSLTELCNRYCKNCPVTGGEPNGNDCTDCICTHIRGIIGEVIKNEY